MSETFEKVSKVPTKVVNGVRIPDVSLEDGVGLALEHVSTSAFRALVGDDALHALIVGSVIIAATVANAPNPIKLAIITVAQDALGQTIAEAMAALQKEKPE